MASSRWSNERSAPFGHAATGANPTDHGKLGVKRSLLTDGDGIPLALIIAGANRHDMNLFCATLDGIVIARPDPTAEHPQHLCLDAGYDYPICREQGKAHHYQLHIHGRGQEQQEKATTPGFRARRWVVERTHSWKITPHLTSHQADLQKRFILQRKQRVFGGGLYSDSEW